MFKFIKNVVVLSLFAGALFYVWSHTPAIVAWAAGVEKPKEIKSPADLNTMGPVGDVFGATNALFAGLAGLGLVYTILLQHDVIAAARKDGEATKKLQQDQTRQMQTTALLTALPILIESEVNRIRVLMPNIDKNHLVMGSHRLENITAVFDSLAYKERVADAQRRYPQGISTPKLEKTDIGAYAFLETEHNKSAIMVSVQKIREYKKKLEDTYNALQ
jgi:hypothetical protein